MENTKDQYTIDLRRDALEKYKADVKGAGDKEKNQIAKDQANEAAGLTQTSKEIRDEDKEGKKSSLSDVISVDNLVVRFLETDEAERVPAMDPGALFVLQKLYLYEATASGKNFARADERRYLAPIVLQLVSRKDYLKLNKGNDISQTDFEKDYSILYTANPKYAERLDYALKLAADKRLITITSYDLDKRISHIKGSVLVKNAEDLIKLSEKIRTADEATGGVSKEEKEKYEKAVSGFLEKENKDLNAVIPEAAQIVLNKLYEYNATTDNKNVANSGELRYLGPIALKLISKKDYMTMNKGNDQDQTEFEKDFALLYRADPAYAKRLEYALKLAEGKPPLNLSAAEVTDRLNFLTLVDNEKKKIEDADRLNKENKLMQAENDRHNSDLQNMIEYFQEDREAQRLSIAIFSNNQEVFWNYVRGIRFGQGPDGNPEEMGLPNGLVPKAQEELEKIIEYKYRKKNLPVPDNVQQLSMLNDITNQMLSEEIMDRCRDLMSKLYMIVDKISPRDLAAEAMQRGNMFKNPQTLITNYLRRFDILQQYKTPEDLKDLTFWRLKQEEFTRMIDVSSRGTVDQANTTMAVKDGKVSTKTPYTYLHPHLRQEKIDSEAGFFRYVQNKVRSELDQRKINHDLRANPYQSTSQTRFWRRQQMTMSQYPTSEIDHFADLKDIETIMQAAHTWDKLNELNLARNNWTLTSLIDRPDPDSGWNKTDRLTGEYIYNLLGVKNADGKITNEDQLLRAINLGIAYNYGPSLRAYTVPASADAGVDKTGKPNMQSFGQGDSALLRVFNPQSFDQLRWSSQTAQEAGLIYAVLTADDAEMKRIYQNWDYRMLQDEIAKHDASFVVGANPEDIALKRVRYADIVNICQIGSMYESGWRKSFSYEGWLQVEKKDVKGSFIAMENIGIEAMKTFLTDSSSNDIEKVDKNFYKDDEAATKKRKDFVEFLYRRYMNPAEAKLTEEQIKHNIDVIFKSIDVEKPNLGKKVGDKYENVEDGYAPKAKRSENYKDFYYMILSRAIAQRLPTKFLRMEAERRRKVSSKRDTAMEAVFKAAKSSLALDIKDEKSWAEQKARGVDQYEETYHQALQDICAAESLLRAEVANKVKHDLKYNDGALHEIKIDNSELTPERLIELWENNSMTKGKVTLDGNDKFDAVRKKNAIAVLRATRGFLFNDQPLPGSDVSYLDEFSQKYKEGPPYGAPFALAIEDFDITLLAHAAQGENSNVRIFDDIATSEEKTVDKMVDYYKTLRKVSKGKDRSYGAIVDYIKDMKSQISSMHGTEYANTFSRWMAIKAIAYFLIRSDSEGFLGWMKSKGDFRSLAAQLGSALPGEVWEWNKVNVWEFCNALSLAEVIPFSPFKTQKTPSMEDMFKLAADGESFEGKEKEIGKDKDGKPILQKEMIKRTDKAGKEWKRRKADFENTGNKLLEIFVKLPVRSEVLKNIGGPLLILILVWMISNIFSGYKGASSGK